MPDSGHPPAHAGAGLVNLPNIITFGRLCAVPGAVWLVLHEEFGGAFWLFAAAGISDGVDGWLARRRGPTTVGALLDATADKALLVSMYVTLAAVRVLPDWLAILVVFRDVVIVGGIVLMKLLGHPLVLRPLWISKLNTALQIVLVGVALLLAALAVDAPWVLLAASWVVAATTLASGAGYVWRVAKGSAA